MFKTGLFSSVHQRQLLREEQLQLKNIYHPAQRRSELQLLLDQLQPRRYYYFMICIFRFDFWIISYKIYRNGHGQLSSSKFNLICNLFRHSSAQLRQRDLQLPLRGELHPPLNTYHRLQLR